MTRTYSIDGEVVLTVAECGGCGVPFGLSEEFVRARQRDHKTFYCPNGCSRWYPKENKEERLARELAEAQARIRRTEARAVHAEDQRTASERSNRALRGHLTRLRNRIAAGVCPWCRRSFRDVMSHVDSKHPEHSHKARQAIEKGGA